MPFGGWRRVRLAAPEGAETPNNRGSPEHRVTRHHRIGAPSGPPRHRHPPPPSPDCGGYTEFMREGSSLRDFAQPPITLVGSDALQAGALVARAVRSVDAPIVETSTGPPRCQVRLNAFHALKITFATRSAISVKPRVGCQRGHRVFLLGPQAQHLRGVSAPGFAFGGRSPKTSGRRVRARSADSPTVLSQILPPTSEIRRG